MRETFESGIEEGWGIFVVFSVVRGKPTADVDHSWCLQRGWRWDQKKKIAEEKPQGDTFIGHLYRSSAVGREEYIRGK